MAATLSKTVQGLIIALINVAFALFIFYWSGSISEKTLYDKYIIRFESASVPVRDLKAAAEFYTNVLNFTPMPATPNELSADLRGFQLPEKRRIVLELRKENPEENGKGAGSGALILIRVRNGFEKLHRELTKRSGLAAYSVDPERYLAQTQPGRVTDIFRGERGKQFVVADPDNNQLLFYSPRKFF